MNAGDIIPEEGTSFLLVGNKGTHKTWFIGTCPTPAYVFDLDNGMSVHAGRTDIDYDSFREIARCRAGTPGIKAEDKLTLTDWQRASGWYEWGRAWPAILNKLNDIGRSMDAGTCQYKTIAFDSLTMLTDAALTYILREHATPANPSGEFKDGRQMWQPFLANMSALFGQFSQWPITKVLTAHIKKDENLLEGTTEKLPLVPGQFAGKVGIYFDEVYYTEANAGKFTFKCQQGTMEKMAASRKYNLPNDLPTDFSVILKHVNDKQGVKHA